VIEVAKAKRARAVRVSGDMAGLLISKGLVCPVRPSGRVVAQ
jgi:hypothetical protein